jgi:hypothetical protein
VSFCVPVEEEHEAEDYGDCDAEFYEDELMCLHERELWAALCLRTARRIKSRFRSHVVTRLAHPAMQNLFDGTS